MAKAPKGMCWRHYQKERRYGDANIPDKTRKRPFLGEIPKCVVDGCDKKSSTKTKAGFCKAHASENRRKNNPIICELLECDSSVHAKGFCMAHYTRFIKYGDPFTVYKPPSYCPQGHEFNNDNTRIYVDKNGHKGRACRVCHRSRQAARRAKYKAGNSVEFIDIDSILERDNWRCKLCGGRILKKAKWPHPRSPSLDHIIPITRGGEHLRSNVQASHFKCNLAKNNKIPEEYNRKFFETLWNQ